MSGKLEKEPSGNFDKQFLINGIAYEFSLVPNIFMVKPADCHNYASALEPLVKSQLDQIFLQKLADGKISVADHKPLRVNAIEAVSKSGSGKPRPITNCSRPASNSVNSYMHPESFKFETLDDAIALSTPLCFYGVVDIQAAFRSVPVFPPNRELQGFRWDFDGTGEKLFRDNFLCFGLSCGPRIFHRITAAVARIMRKREAYD